MDFLCIVLPSLGASSSSRSKMVVPTTQTEEVEGQTGNLKCSHRPFVGPHYLESPYKGSSFRGKLRPPGGNTGQAEATGWGWGLWRPVEAWCGDSIWLGFHVCASPFPKGSLQAHLPSSLSLMGRWNVYRLYKSIRTAGGHVRETGRADAERLAGRPLRDSPAVTACFITSL